MPSAPAPFPDHLVGLHRTLLLAAGGAPLLGGDMGGEVGKALKVSSLRASPEFGFQGAARSLVARGFLEQKTVKILGLIPTTQHVLTAWGGAVAAPMERQLEAASSLLPRLLQQQPDQAVAIACALGWLLMAGVELDKYSALAQSLHPLRTAASVLPQAAPVAEWTGFPQADDGASALRLAPLSPQQLVSMIDAMLQVAQLRLHPAQASSDSSFMPS